jgi:hypothetical protein
MKPLQKGAFVLGVALCIAALATGVTLAALAGIALVGVGVAA